EGQYAVAATDLERARLLLTTELGHDDPLALNATGNLAKAYEALGRLDEALSATRRRLGPDHPSLYNRYYATAQAQTRRHNYGMAHKYIDEAIRISRKHMGEDNTQTAN